MHSHLYMHTLMATHTHYNFISTLFPLADYDDFVRERERERRERERERERERD